MENELTNVMEEEVVNELENVNQASGKAMIIGIGGLVIGTLLFAFRKKIKAGIEKCKAKRLSKKNAANPEQNNEDIEQQIFEPLE